ncbi:AFR040Wp [Eremothecium gossypii ATCC 10895]|uniref:non-specific serine/threonine protein kinase n=1 Tax=Eremothecium gossypii (strain ATCC 10895 / CBS 109.51 / FGSC 9923 / NRRL Y-1056) TaxID=284811 RepID=Q754N2_EREGS|nr:AFR040Wp [Eremothecium gossypii ATCC 10895]AAS53411.1 AFR040Wp [Eremothecium gossypii ATCC 10895]AEY97722.1 FAFR040Wp [Eremothecium gossypii FDAG1]
MNTSGAVAAASTALAVNNMANTKMNAASAAQQQASLSQSHTFSQQAGVAGSNVSTVSGRDDTTIVGLHFKIGKKIGEGSFGVLFEGTNMINGVPVAIKFEPRKTEAPQLKDEYRTYKILAGTSGVPQAYYFGQEGLHNILVIDLLGPSLEDLFDWCGRRFSVKTVVQVAVQMITLIEDLHAHDLIYRDIKPDNFLIGRPDQPDANKVHLIDFGMAKLYRDPKTKQHIPYREKKSLSGTARYMSINTHLGREQSRRDDMEALGHVFFYFLRGQLPWQGLKAPNNKQKYEKIGEKKRSTNVYDLSQGLPVQFGRYLEIVRNLGFEETPDYDGYRKLLLSTLEELGLEYDGEYDWMKLNGGRGWDLTINKKPNLHGYGHPNPPNEKGRRHRSKYPQPSAPQQMSSPQDPRYGSSQLQLQQRLDPTSYEAYQQQTQQRYAQQQLKLQHHQPRLNYQAQPLQQSSQQPQAQQQNQQTQNQQTQQQQTQYRTQQQAQYPFPSHSSQPGMHQKQGLLQGQNGSVTAGTTTANGKQQDVGSVSSGKGFFSKMGCC